MSLTLTNAISISISRPTGDAALDQDTGLYNDGTFATIVGKASRQPLKGRELLLLPEADRVRHSVKFYSETEILDGDEVADVTSGEVFYIKNPQDWARQRPVLKYYKAIGFLKDDTS